MTPDIISSEDVKPSIKEFLATRYSLLDSVYDLDELNKSQAENKALLKRLQAVYKAAKDKHQSLKRSPSNYTNS